MLDIKQFIIAKNETGVLGFARILKHASCDEYCTLGVIETKRSQGIAKQITEAIIKISTQDLFLVCIIPEYFKKLNFKVVDNYPNEIKNKLHYCVDALSVPEKYVAMQYLF